MKKMRLSSTLLGSNAGLATGQKVVKMSGDSASYPSSLMGPNILFLLLPLGAMAAVVVVVVFLVAIVRVTDASLGQVHYMAATNSAV
jgi:hypothetical protein